MTVLRGKIVQVLLAGVWAGCILAAAEADGRIGVAHVQGRTFVYEDRQGRLIAEGDIEIAPAASTQTPAQPRANGAVINEPQFLWPGGVIPYEIDPALPDTSRISAAMQQWSEQTPVRFVPRRGETDYVYFVRDPGFGICLSTIGRTRGAQKLTLSDQCSTGSVVHELGHAIGLFHEQSRPDRDRFVQLNRDNLDKLQWIQYSSSLAYGDTFQTARLAGAYDYGSVMHYGVTSFSRNGAATMTTNPPGITVGQATSLSAGDIAAVRRLYGSVSTGVVVTSNPPGLTVNVDGIDVVTPQWFDWTAGSTHHVSAGVQGADGTRYLFGRWNSSTEAEQDITVDAGLDVVTAHFIRQFKLNTGTLNGKGAVQVEPASPDGFYPSGTTITISAIPDGGQEFVSWSGRNYFPTHGLGANPATFVLNDPNISYYANATTNPVTRITANYPGIQAYVDGALRTLPYAAAWEAGSSHTVVLANSTFYNNTGSTRRICTGWSNGGGPAQTLVADGTATSLHAQCRQQFFVSSGATLPASGLVQLSPASPDGYYDEGTQLNVVALANSGYLFVNWSGDLTSDSPVESLTVTDQVLVLANLRPH